MKTHTQVHFYALKIAEMTVLFAVEGRQAVAECSVGLSGDMLLSILGVGKALART